MSQHSISELFPLPSAPLATGTSYPPFEKPAVTPPSTANSYTEDLSKSKSTPWYRTTKGLAIIIVIVLVVVGIIVGVAVGVTQGKKNTSNGGAPREPNRVTSAVAATPSVGSIFSTGRPNGVPTGNGNAPITLNNGNGPILVTTAPISINV